VTTRRAQVLAIVRANGRRLQGERRLPFFLILLPITIMLLVGTIFGTGGKRLAVGVVADQTHDALARDLVSAMSRSDRVKPRHVGGPEAVRRAVRRGRITAAIIVPSDYGESIRRGGVGGVTLVVQPGRSESAEARITVGAILARTNLDIEIARALQANEGLSFDAAFARARQASASVPDFLADKKRRESPFSYTAPSNLVLFAFITALVTSATVVSSRRMGVTRRELASPTPAGAVIAGELVGAFLVALLQASMMLTIGGLFFGVSWGPPVAVFALLCVFALVSAGAGLLLATFVRTPEQAVTLGPPLGIAMGMLGGCMWPLEGVGPVMRAVGHMVPHGWAMDAFIRLVFDHRGLGGIAAPLGALLLYAALLLGAATIRLRRSVLLS
jgi:ABC-2 type transport system permease protein